MRDKRRKVCPEDILKKYNDLSKEYAFKVSITDMNSGSYYFVTLIKKELGSLGYDEDLLTDYLVAHLYKNDKRNKALLWCCYGDRIVNNIKNNLGLNEENIKIVQCIDCGEYIEVPKRSKACRCFYCQTERDRILNAKHQQTFRDKIE